MNQTREHSLIQGNILKSLISFAFPVLLALFLQAMYGAADLIIVGQFADTFEQSGIKTALVAGFIMGCIAFFAGNLLSAIFSSEGEVIAYAHDYLKAYAIDCLLTAVLFCFVGYFNGCGKTVFVMVQGVVGAFCVRIPAVYLMSQIDGASLFHIGLGTPISSVAQIILCILAYRFYKKKSESKSRGIPIKVFVSTKQN